jgi:hypothetical protein
LSQLVCSGSVGSIGFKSTPARQLTVTGRVGIGVSGLAWQAKIRVPGVGFAGEIVRPWP